MSPCLSATTGEAGVGARFGFEAWAPLLIDRDSWAKLLSHTTFCNIQVVQDALEVLEWLRGQKLDDDFQVHRSTRAAVFAPRST